VPLLNYALAFALQLSERMQNLIQDSRVATGLLAAPNWLSLSSLSHATVSLQTSCDTPISSYWLPGPSLVLSSPPCLTTFGRAKLAAPHAHRFPLRG
jgi:hypothetical protein